jgi:TolB-like protein/Flp pilus assembly protein TadD
MAIPLTSNVTVCSICGAPLNAKGDCVACLIRTALDESVIEKAPPESLLFGDFEIARRADGSLWELGHGGMGVTYLAVDNVLRRKVALKVIEVPQAARTSHAVRERFLREARAAAALRHPNVAAVFQFGASPDGRHCYYAMELVEGETLEARVRRDGPLDAKLVLEIATQVTRALMAAAAHGLIHRDLKPGNIMLVSPDGEMAGASAQRGGYKNVRGGVATALRRRAGRKAIGLDQNDEGLEVKVIDFGLAKAIAAAESEMDITHGEFVGTPNFASPEQFESGPVDVRSDIYSLGATLWFALTGKTPFAGRNIEEIRSAQQSGALPVKQLDAARVPSRLRSLLKSMLAFEPAARPGIHDLAARLQRCSAEAIPERIRGVRVALAAAFILIVGVSAGIYFSSQRSVSATKSPSGRIMLAVLPFANSNSDPDQELFSDGLTDEMISQLGRLQPERLGVIARTSTVKYKRTNKGIPEIGRELGVNYILEGTVRSAGPKVRVSTELIQVSDQRRLFAQSYEQDSPDITGLQQEMTEAVSKEVGSKLNLAYQRSPVSAQRTNPEAYEAYLRGCRYFDDSEFDKSIDYFNQAIKLDPNYGPSYAKLAVAYYWLAFFNMLPPNVAFERTRNAALHALEKDDTLSEAHGALAQVKLHYDLDFAGAESEFKRALELDPNDAAVRHDYSHYLLAMGRAADSAAETAKAVALDPVSIDLIGCLCWHRYAARQYDDSITWAKKAIQMAPDDGWSHLVLGWAYEQQARLPEAIDELEKAVKLSKDSEYALAALGHAYAIAGEKEELGTILEKLKGISAHGYVSAFDLAVIYAGLGDKEQAFRWLEKAYEERSSFLVYSLWEPRLDPLRSEPRFQQLLHTIGLPVKAINAGKTEADQLGNGHARANGPSARIMLAVLPFENLSGDPDQEFFSDGLTEEMISQLGQLEPQRLGVIARTSALQYKGTKKGIREISGELGVNYVLEGTVRRAGPKVRVSAQLVQVSDQTDLLAESYERDLGDVLALQNDVARAIAERVQIKLTAQPQMLAGTHPVSPDVHELYLKGRYFWNKRTEDGLKKAADYFQQAIQKDPNYAQAYAGLADCYGILSVHGTLPSWETYPKAEAAAMRALEIDDRLAEAHASLGWARFHYDWDPSAAEREYKKAIELNPNYETAHHWYALYLAEIGRQEEAYAEIERARQLDPLSLIINANMGWLFYFARSYDQAAQQLRETLKMDPNFAQAHYYLGRTYEQKGMFAEAIAELQQAVSLSGGKPVMLAGLAHAYAASGNRRNAEEILKQLQKLSNQVYVSPCNVAPVYVALGQKEQAFEWLKRAYQDRDTYMVWLNVVPEWDGSRSESRFQDLLHGIGLVP